MSFLVELLGFQQRNTVGSTHVQIQTCSFHIHKIKKKKECYIKKNNTLLCTSPLLLFWLRHSTACPCWPSSGSQTNVEPLIDYAASEVSSEQARVTHKHTQLSSTASSKMWGMLYTLRNCSHDENTEKELCVHILTVPASWCVSRQKKIHFHFISLL